MKEKITKKGKIASIADNKINPFTKKASKVSERHPMWLIIFLIRVNKKCIMRIDLFEVPG